MKERELKCKGKVDYDFKHDILFFKSENRNYKKSVEIDNLVVDIDEEDYIVGIQIFEASKFLNLKKSVLMHIPKWEFSAKTDLNSDNQDQTRIEIRLAFTVKVRNQLIEKNPIIMPHPIMEKLPDSKMTCVA